jgi:PPOX class probable F420-dependent enzyme
VQTAELRTRFASRPIAHLATIRPDGRPHIVPMVFALVDDTVYSAVDAKPKRSSRLQRLTNIRADPRCALLVDSYDDDWRRLWWVRADGNGEIVDEPPGEHPGIQALVRRFGQYIDDPPTGPLLVVSIRQWTGWAASP